MLVLLQVESKLAKQARQKLTVCSLCAQTHHNNHIDGFDTRVHFLCHLVVLSCSDVTMARDSSNRLQTFFTHHFEPLLHMAHTDSIIRTPG